MATYESFNTKKNKIQNIWEKSEKNSNDLDIIPTTSVDFNSINFNKKITIFPILDDELVSGVIQINTITLKNFPEWAINMIEVNCFYTMDDAYTEFPIVDLSEVAESNLKKGQIFFPVQEFKYWFNRIDNKDFYLKTFSRIAIRQVRTDGNDFGDLVPAYMTLNLKILNKRIYEKMSGKKE